MSEWIAVAEKTPAELSFPYQVLAVCKKQHDSDSCYAGTGIRGVYQDWVIRRHAGNFTHWMVIPPVPSF